MRKTIVILLLLVSFLFSSSFHIIHVTADEENEKDRSRSYLYNYPLGDANKDMLLTISDARLILRAAIGLDEFSVMQRILCDANRDFKIDMDDVAPILNKIINSDCYYILGSWFCSDYDYLNRNNSDDVAFVKNWAELLYSEQVEGYDSLENNTLFSPDMMLYCHLREYKYGQFAVDLFPAIISYDRLGSDNPIVCGHQSRPLGLIYMLNIGDVLYYTDSDGNCNKYKVFVSEEADEVDEKKDLKGRDTGARLITVFEKPTMHLYTCYGPESATRWMAFAEKMTDNTRRKA